MDDLAPVPTQPPTDQDRNQPDHLGLMRKRGKEKKAKLSPSGKKREEPNVAEKHKLDVLA